MGLNIEQTEIASFGFLDVRLDIPGFQKFLKTNIASVSSLYSLVVLLQ